MKRLVFIVILGLFVLVACEQKTDLIIHNKTGHNVYFSIDDEGNNTIAGNDTHYRSFSLGRSSIFNDVSKNIRLAIEGETYCMPYDYKEIDIKLTKDNDYRIYLWPVTASVRIVNNSNEIINNVQFRKSYPNTMNLVGIEVEGNCLDTVLLPGDEAWYRLDPVNPSYPNNPTVDRHPTMNPQHEFYFTYTFEVYTASGRTDFGGEGLPLRRDEQYVIFYE